MTRSTLPGTIDGLTDDELLALGAALEIERYNVASELDAATRLATAEQRSIRKATVKLGINTAIAAGGIVAAPLTFGISLLFTVGGIVMLL
jgi:hypothetical protein